MSKPMIRPQKSRYEPLESIASGTTSLVSVARDNVIGRIVALKTFVHGFGEELEEQFLQEARLVGQLSHPAIVQLYDVGIDEQGAPFLVMEYIAGKTLEQRLTPFSLTVQRACAWAADLAGAFGGMGSQTVFGPRGSATVTAFEPNGSAEASDAQVLLDDFTRADARGSTRGTRNCTLCAARAQVSPTAPARSSASSASRWPCSGTTPAARHCSRVAGDIDSGSEEISAARVAAPGAAAVNSRTTRT